MILQSRMILLQVLDVIHYQILKQLPDQAWKYLFPSWQEATVMPIPQLGKNKTKPSSYVPIAATSFSCKSMERIINYRLVWKL